MEWAETGSSVPFPPLPIPQHARAHNHAHNTDPPTIPSLALSPPLQTKLAELRARSIAAPPQQLAAQLQQRAPLRPEPGAGSLAAAGAAGSSAVPGAAAAPAAPPQCPSGSAGSGGRAGGLPPLQGPPPAPWAQGGGPEGGVGPPDPSAQPLGSAHSSVGWAPSPEQQQLWDGLRRGGAAADGGAASPAPLPLADSLASSLAALPPPFYRMDDPTLRSWAAGIGVGPGAAPLGGGGGGGGLTLALDSETGAPRAPCPGPGIDAQDQAACGGTAPALPTY